MEQKNENENSSQPASKESKANNKAYLSSFDKCIAMMKNGEWALLETWLRNINKIDFDVNGIDQVFFVKPIKLFSFIITILFRKLV
jgi:hypothetical protein